MPANSRKNARPRELGRHTVTNQIKDIVQARGLSAYGIAKDSGVSLPVVSRFLSGERDIRGATLDKIAASLNLRLVEVASKGRGRKPAGPSQGE